MISAQPTKLLVSDVDRTLLTDDYRLLPDVSDAISHISEHGVRVVLATARGPRALKVVTDKLPAVKEAICFGGALTVECSNHGWADHPSSAGAVLSAAQKAHIIDVTRACGVSLALYTRDMVYVDVLDERLSQEFSHTGDVYQTANLQNVAIETFKFLAISSKDETELLDQIKSRLDGSLYAARSHANYLEIGLSGISKGGALQAFCSAENFLPDETVAIGDSENDLSMFDVVGNAIAMANGSDAIRRAADWVTKSNEDGGVAWAISEYAPKFWSVPEYMQPASN